MNAEAIRDLRDAKPFVPFTLRLADGRSCRVTHPEVLFLPPKNPRMVIVATPEGGIRILDALLIVEATLGRAEKPRRRAG